MFASHLCLHCCIDRQRLGVHITAFDTRIEYAIKSYGSSQTLWTMNVTGRVILPAWWVYDCLFEYERDVRGNKGLDPYSEKVVVLKTMVKGKMREGTERLKPKLSAYSNR